jgi:hemoglobin
MQRATRWNVLFTACLTVAAATGAAPAAEDKPAAGTMDRKSFDLLIYANMREVIDHGANLYNAGDWNGCYRLWEGALMNVKPLLAHRGDLQKAIDDSLTNARQEPLLQNRAFVLRKPLDKIRTDISGDYSDETKALDAKARREKAEREKAARETAGGAPPVAPKSDKALWDRLGGEPGVTRLVDDFLNAVVADPKVDFYRHGKVKLEAAQVAKMKREMVEQVSQVTGGPLKYTGPDMKKIHKDMGITDAQFDAVIGHLQKTLEKNNVAESDKKTILAAINSQRKEIVQPKKTEENKPEDKKPDEKNPAGTASVQGRITFKGQPLAGTIVLTNKEGKVEGKIAEDGTYQVKGVKPGEYTVSISDAKGAVPAKYNTKSTLRFDIKDGQNTVDLQLQ